MEQDNKYPRAIYRPDGDDIEWDHKRFGYGEVNDEEEEAEALASGWYLHPKDFPGENGEPSLLDKNAKDIAEALPGLSLEELEALKADETAGKSRKSVLSEIDAAIDAKLKA